ncbi:hypothetical protein BSL78_13521 [Apostichopus japonicus]|uniref:Protein FAM221A n=1 Tax=Stichopus japonicus TaxID=307972 RepID=A0A2G8KNP7_STIJA|nr:hypothetical protein BSL78_13521 [Apostichopus japonicus]
MSEPDILKFGPGSAEAVDAYLNYRRIVGDDDNGQLFTPEEYENYKKKVLPARLRNRLFVSWTSPNGMDCKLVGPETLCFCQHRYKQHKTDFQVLPTVRPIDLPCKLKKCRCSTFQYVPMNGGQSVRCRCKHFSEDHDEGDGHACVKCKGKCGSFRSPWSCPCGQPAYLHQMVVENKEERLARGHPVGQDVPYAAMGGLTGFSSLADAYLRLDSGVGAPDESFFSGPVTSSDHPFLRMHAEAGGLSEEDAVTSGLGAVRLTGTNRDMDYYEQRYQARLKEERLQARAGATNSQQRDISKKPSRKLGPPKR